MEPWRTLALTGYSCEDFPSKATRNYLLLKNDETRRNITHRIRSNRNMVKKKQCDDKTDLLKTNISVSPSRDHIYRVI